MLAAFVLVCAKVDAVPAPAAAAGGEAETQGVQAGAEICHPNRFGTVRFETGKPFFSPVRFPVQFAVRIAGSASNFAGSNLF